MKKFLASLAVALLLALVWALALALDPVAALASPTIAPSATAPMPQRLLPAAPPPGSADNAAVPALVAAQEADLYVSPGGSDSNPGSAALPFRTIGRAASRAVAGSTVHVAPGTYIGNIETRSAGTAEARIRYEAVVAGAARLVGQGQNTVWTNYGDYVDIAGFDISGSGRIGILNMGSHTLIEGNHVHHLTLSGGCTGNGGAGIDNGNYAGRDGDIVGNIVHDIGSPGACNGVHGIYSSNQGGHIVNNLVYRASAFGIHLWHAATHVTVANNTVFANGSASMGGGIVLGNGDSPRGGILNHSKVINNIVYDNPAASIKEFCYPGQECTGRDNLFANNLVFHNGRPIALRHGRAKNTIVADPQFVAYRPDGSGDYRLKPGSPAIGKGARLTSSGDDQATGQGPKPRADLGANIAQIHLLPAPAQGLNTPSH